MEVIGTLYDELPLDVLAGFFYYINLNIDKGTLSDAMQTEIKLIEGAAKTRGIPLEELYEKGSYLVKMERKRQGHA